MKHEPELSGTGKSSPALQKRAIVAWYLPTHSYRTRNQGASMPRIGQTDLCSSVRASPRSGYGLITWWISTKPVRVVANGKEVFNSKVGFDDVVMEKEFMRSFDRRLIWVNKLDIAIP